MRNGVTASVICRSPPRPSRLALLEEREHTFPHVVAPRDRRGRDGGGLPPELVAFGHGRVEQRAGSPVLRPGRRCRCARRARARRATAPPGSVTTFTSPSAYARSGSRRSPVSNISRATLSGSARGVRKRPPQVGTRPRFTSGSPNDASRAATTRSHASTISNPPPSAGPSTAAMSGLARSRRITPYSPPRSVVALPSAGRRQVGAGGEDRRGSR